MSPTDVALDIDRVLDSAVADVGDALELRRRAVADRSLRSGIRSALQPAAEPSELDAARNARRAVALFILGRDEEVGRYAAAAESHRVLYLSGQSAIYRDLPFEAARVLERCVQLEPRDDTARLQLAGVEAVLGRPDAARKTLEPLADQTDRPQVLFVLGAIAEAEGEYGEAREHYEAALAQDPEHVDTLFRLAYQYDLRGDDDAAIMLYERARRVKPTRANILLNLGVLYEDRSEFEKAATCYREVLQQFPNHPRAKPFLRDADSSKSMVVDEDMERKEDRRNQLLRTPISDFELSVRSRNCLAKMNIQSLGDLMQRTEAELLSYKNFGETSLQEIKDILTAKGLRLGMRRDEVVVPGNDEPTPTLPDVPEDMADNANLGTPIADLDLSIRASKCMVTLGVQTVGDLLRYTEEDLLRMKNFGETSLEEIRSKLANLGLAMRRA